MKPRRPLVLAAAAILALPLAPEPVSADMDYNLVGRAAVGRLRALHFNKLPYDADLARKTLDEYLRSLDFQKLYFLQEDVDTITKKWGDNLHLQMIDANMMRPATRIHDLFRKRVEERHAWIERKLKENEFDFSTDLSVELSRENSPWPKNAGDADALWTARLKEAVLREKLRAEEAAERAARNNKPAPEAEDPSEIADRILKRYVRILENIRETNQEDIADLMLSALCNVYDPHTEYFSFSEETQFQTNMSNQLIGIGALLQADDDGTTQIKGIVVNGPADKGGQLKLDDRVIAVDTDNSGEFVDVVYMKLNRVVEMIRGKAGTEVRLKVIPADDPSTTREIVIKREKVELKDQLATGQIIERKGGDGVTRRLGWINIPSFYADFEKGSTGVTRDVRRILDRMMRENIDGLAIDLRMNGGGSLEEAISLTGLFIPSGPVVQAKNSKGEIEVRDSRGRRPVYDGPLAVLVDRTSASASEIFAAALQDYNRAVIIGDSSTFGKGTVQTVSPLGGALPLFADSSRAGSLKVTISKFYRIAGGSTQLRGVVPDIILPSRMEALKIGESAMRNPLPYDTIAARPFRALPEENLAIQKLSELSAARVAADPEFQYIQSDIETMKEQIEKNELSLNAETRRSERLEREEKNRQRNTERRDRFASIEASEGKSTTIYRITVDNSSAKQLEVQKDFSGDDNSAMRRTLSDEEKEAREENPEYPLGLDPAKRETLDILKDLIRITSGQTAQTVKTQP